MKKIAAVFIKVCISIVVVLTILFISLIIWVDFEVHKVVKVSQKIYKQGEINSLIMMLQDEKNDLKKRNSAVWALGQIGDKEALPVLEKLYTGEECDHSKFLCQYELKKAIKKINGAANIARVFYFMGK